MNGRKPLARRKSAGNQSSTVDGAAEDDDASSVAHSASASEATGSISHSTSAIRMFPEDRQEALEQDELTGEVRLNEVFCKACEKWIKLSPRTPYSLVNWKKHAARVHGRRE